MKLREFLAKPFAVSLASFGLLAVLATAGSLTPAAAPGSTMQTLAQVYNAVAGTFDSSGIASSSTGSLIQQLKYISLKVSRSFDPTSDQAISGDWTFSGGLNGSAQDLTLAHLGTPTFTTVQDMQDLYHSSGWTSGGAITDLGGGTV
ncbi:MAG TPA: hypothetical protein VMJ72_02000, partial [Candidatus Paceibacterota bacterium]|nr:hypothetical protein [Candidatus Paceibacterota bacterium]